MVSCESIIIWSVAMIILERGDDYDFFIFLFYFLEKELKYHSLARKDIHRPPKNNKQQTQKTRKFFCPKLTPTQICSHNLTAQRLVKFLRPLKTASELKLHCIVFFFLFLFFFFFFFLGEKCRFKN